MSIVLDHVPSETNEYLRFVNDQKLARVESFQLESGVELTDVTVAYKTWGKLNANGDNCLIICHALSGSSDVEDWWGPLLGYGKAFDTSRFFVFCANVLGSPYGTTSPLSRNPKTGRLYGPEFPQTSVRDDVRLHKLVLDALGVTSVAAVVGGSMGGFLTLEWPLCFPGYIKNIVPISTSVNHDAWGIAWAEAQRQCVFADPAYQGGYYHPTPATQPASGLAAARMVAMLTYRSSPSFHARFGRSPAAKDGRKPKTPNSVPNSIPNGVPNGIPNGVPNDASTDVSNGVTNGVTNGVAQDNLLLQPAPLDTRRDSKISEDAKVVEGKAVRPTFTAQSYLQYQGQKFVGRFDANCFIHLTRKMDHHDLTRGRIKEQQVDGVQDSSDDALLSQVLSIVPPKSLVVGITSDVLFTPEQQDVLARNLPEASLVMIPSAQGHDGFLLEFETLGPLIDGHLRERCPWVYEGPPLVVEDSRKVVKDSLFGEVESGW